MPAAGHLTCVGLTRAEIDIEIQRYWNLGVRHIVALRGDVPVGHGAFEPHPDGYATLRGAGGGDPQAGTV